MQNLTAAQSGIGKSISQLLENFRKESIERRTIENTKSYEERLNGLWTKFCENHDEIVESEDFNKEHSYFVKNYFNQVEKVYNEFLQRLSERLEVTTATSSHTDEPEHHDELVPLTGSLKMRKQVKATIAALERIIKVIEREHADPHPRAYYTQKLRSINQYWDTIASLHGQIMAELDDDSYDIREYTKIEDHFQETATRLQGKLDEQSVTTINGNVKLPKLTLPIFDGNYTKWGQFKDLYSQLIHNRPLSGAEKLYYLKTNLTGEPSGLIKHLQATDDNYSVAWKLLLERYDNPRAIVTATLNQLLYQAALTTESGSGIKRLHDTSKECLLALENSGIEIKQWNPILLHLLTQKLDKESRRLYEQSLNAPHELQTMDDFFKFMETRFQMLEVIQTKEERKRVSTLTASSQVLKCAVCKADHGVFRCPKFLYATLDNRIQLIRQFKLCPNCLKLDHTVHDCTSRGCMKCGKRHNTLIHNSRQPEKPRNLIQAKSRQGIVRRSTDLAPMNYQQVSRGSSGATRQLESTSQFQEISRSTPSETTNSQISSLQASTRSQSLLATAIIKVTNASGVPVNCRVLLDSGSQLHFICERLVQALGLPRSKTSLPISGVGGIATTAKYETTLTIHSRVKSFSAVINAVILKTISDRQPSQYIKTSNWDIPTSIQLADPAFYKPQSIDMLLGAELFFQLLQEGQIRLHNLPLLQNTHFGWILAGKVPTQAGCTQSCHIATQPSVSALDKQLQQFWELEQHDSPSKYKSREELLCEEQFQNTFQRSASGQYIVKLPFRELPTTLGSSLEIASKRFYALERKLERNADLKRQYHDFMTEYQELGHMQPIAKEAIPTDHYYMPHHCVAKAHTNKPKFRVVFDASAKTSSGRSINDILMVGPTVQPDLFTIITKFRMYKYAMTADICKMYRQISVHPNDRKYQLILWRDDREKPLQTYQLNTVTYGTAAAPFIATRCLNQLALAEYDTFPEAANMILGNTYVDDILTGADSKQSMLKLKNDLIELLKGGGFELRKFCANHPDTLRNVPEDHKEKMLLIDNGEVTKTLGLIWQPKEDSFQYQATEGETQGLTKRTVLSEVARIFDPLGLIGPVTVLGKLFLQDLWKAKCSWDEELPAVYKNKWMKFKKSLPGLRAIKIPRHVLFSNSVNIQLHAFSDSSESAYGACCYLRSMNTQGEIRVRLLCAKSRLAPVKATTLARLELCAALLMTELVERVSQCMQINPSRIVYHTDSTIVLAWISSPSYTWSTFIAHRVEKIQQLTQPQQWRHIEGTQNPADIISRGMFPDALSQSTVWFKGPRYLSEPEEKWPTFAFKIPDEIPEAKPKKSVFTAIERVKHVDLVTPVNHCNSFLKLQRIFAYCFRFLQNCKSPKGSRKMGEVSIAELDIALNGIIKNIQRTAFEHEYSSLKKGEALDSHHSIQHLAPFVDASTGIIKVGGRLKNSELSQEAKNQILLPKDHKLSELLFNYLHNQHMHAAPQALTAIARQKYWVIDARRLARHTVHRCIRCFRCKPKPVDQMMGELPVERVKPTRPFHTTGVDFCGPIMIHYKLRGKTPTKAYIAVFVCFTTKAVHLELVSDLSAEAFLNALKRFIARRGLCATIFCDNATNFLGARTHLKELKDMLLSQDLQSSLAQLCIKNHIEWKPIPPRSPHFGGLWEAAVKSAKNHLIRQTGNANLTYEELHTVIVQIEAILNSRPITPMSSDPNDLEALTPGHFLTGSPLTACAETDVAERDIDKLTRFRRIQHIQQTFWQRWSAEYLQELQTRNKWRSIKPNLKPGTLVVIREANLPPLKWSLGRVLETFDGADKLTRVVSVKTPSGIFKRTIHNLCPLPEEQYTPEDLKGNASGSNLGNDSKSVEGTQPKTSFLTFNQVPGPSHKDVEGEPPAKRMKHKRPYHPLRGRFLPINSNWKNSPFVENFKKNPTNATETNKSPTARSISSSAALKLLMLTSLIMPAFGNPLREPAEVTPFSSNPGIFFESLGHAHLINSQWTILAYYKLDNYWSELAGIRKCIGEISKLCNTTTLRRDHCLEILSQFQHQLTQIEEANEILHKQGGRDRVPHKRSPLDLVGNVANKLFGILDSSYAKYIEEEIEKTRSNEGYLMQLAKNQTSVLETTTNIMKRQEESIQKQFKAIQDHILAFSKFVDDVQLEQQATQAFSALSLLTTLVLQNYHRAQNALLDVITDIHHNKISPLLITPMQLRDQVTLIKDHIPSTLTIPGNIKDGVLLLYNLMTVGTRIGESYILFDIRIPLVLDEYFQLFKMIPVPIQQGDKLLLIKPSSDYLIVSLPRERYYPLSQAELNKCQHLREDQYLCDQNHPIFNLKANVSQCEMELLNHRQTLSSNCHFRSSNRSNLWIQLHTPNSWLYHLDSETTFNIVCGTAVTLKTLQKSGILKLRPDCSIKQISMTITGHGRYQSKTISAFIPRINLSLSLDEDLHSAKRGHPYISSELHLKSNDHEIDVLTNKVKDLKQYSEALPHGISHHDIHHYTISYMLLAALMIGCSYWMVTKWNHGVCSRNMPPHCYSIPPIPARRNQPDNNDDFVLRSNPRGQDD